MPLEVVAAGERRPRRSRSPPAPASRAGCRSPRRRPGRRRRAPARRARRASRSRPASSCARGGLDGRREVGQDRARAAAARPAATPCACRRSWSSTATRTRSSGAAERARLQPVEEGGAAPPGRRPASTVTRGGATSIRPTLARAALPSPSPSTEVEAEPRRGEDERRRHRHPPDPGRDDLDALLRGRELALEVEPEPLRHQRRADRERDARRPSGATRASPSSPCATRCAAARTPLISSSSAEKAADGAGRARHQPQPVDDVAGLRHRPRVGRPGVAHPRLASRRRAPGGGAARAAARAGTQRPEEAPPHTSTGSATCAPTSKTRL